MPWEMHDKAEQLYLHVQRSSTELTATLRILCSEEDHLDMFAKAATTLGGGSLTSSSPQLWHPGLLGAPLGCSPQCHSLSRHMPWLCLQEPQHCWEKRSLTPGSPQLCLPGLLRAPHGRHLAQSAVPAP